MGWGGDHSKVQTVCGVWRVACGVWRVRVCAWRMFGRHSSMHRPCGSSGSKKQRNRVCIYRSAACAAFCGLTDRSTLTCTIDCIGMLLAFEIGLKIGLREWRATKRTLC